MKDRLLMYFVLKDTQDLEFLLREMILKINRLEDRIEELES
jgi:hypothetical protein